MISLPLSASAAPAACAQEDSAPRGERCCKRGGAAASEAPAPGGMAADGHGGSCSRPRSRGACELSFLRLRTASAALGITSCCQHKRVVARNRASYHRLLVRVVEGDSSSHVCSRCFPWCSQMSVSEEGMKVSSSKACDGRSRCNLAACCARPCVVPFVPFNKAQECATPDPAGRLLPGLPPQGYRSCRATHGAREGAWYFEVRIEHLGETGAARLGWCALLSLRPPAPPPAPSRPSQPPPHTPASPPRLAPAPAPPAAAQGEARGGDQRPRRRRRPRVLLREQDRKSVV